MEDTLARGRCGGILGWRPGHYDNAERWGLGKEENGWEL